MPVKNNLFQNFQKNIFFYKNSQYLGASNLLNRFLSNPPETLIPASVSHGVDFYHTYFAQDIDSIEPIHWACRGDVDRIKPTFIAPHPWTINYALSDFSQVGSGSLVIGPPPSIENDLNLLDHLKKNSISNYDILIKPRGNYQESMQFWQNQGATTRTVGPPDKDFYTKLTSILSSYKNIICPTISSALFFSASIGKNIITIPEFTFKVFENMNYLDEVNENSFESRDIVKKLVNGSSKEITEVSKFLLGFDYLGDALQINKSISEFSSSVVHPFNLYKGNKIPYSVREFFTLATKKQKIMRMDYKDYIKLISKGHVGVMTMCEFDFRLNGKNSRNFND